jgi:aminopeptidase YwaD
MSRHLGLAKKEVEFMASLSMNRTQIQIHIKKLSEIGQKESGSSREHEAARYIAEKLNEIGFENVQMESFRVASWQNNGTEVRVEQPVSMVIPSVPFGYSPSTPPNGIEAELVYVGKGREIDYRGKKVDGAIALVDCDNEVFWVRQYILAVKNGASALIRSSPLEKFIKIETIGMKAPLSIPFIAIPGNYANKLINLMSKNKVELFIKSETSLDPNGTSYNVVGEINPKNNCKEKIFLTSHYDSWFMGANDNATAVAVMLEVSRALIQQNLRRQIKFVSFGSEESGSLEWICWTRGSINYLMQHPDEIIKIMGLINGEMLGAGDTICLESTPEFTNFITGVTKDLNIESEDKVMIKVPPSTISDHWPFLKAGVPSIGIWRIWYPEYHTDADMPDIIDAEKLENCLRIIGLSALRLATAEILPYNIVKSCEIIEKGTPVKSILGRIDQKGLIELYEKSKKMLDLSSLVESFSKLKIAAATLQNTLSLYKPRKEEDGQKLNSRLREIFQLLNPEIIGSGGRNGSDEIFLVGLYGIEDMIRLNNAIDELHYIIGADIESIVKDYIEAYPFHPSFTDVYSELCSLQLKLKELVNQIRKNALSLDMTFRETIALVEGIKDDLT